MTDKAALLLSLLAIGVTVANLIVTLIFGSQLHRLRQLSPESKVTERVTERERIIIDKTEPGRVSQLWYVIREQPLLGNESKTEIWATDNPAKVSSIRKNKYRRFFMTTVIAFSANDARTKSEDSHKWKELFP